MVTSTSTADVWMVFLHCAQSRAGLLMGVLWSSQLSSISKKAANDGLHHTTGRGIGAVW